MGRAIYKTGDDEYIMVSSVIDKPTTYFCTRDEMRDILSEPSPLNDGWWMPNETYVLDLLDLADARLTTSRIGAPPQTYEEALDEIIATYNVLRHMNRQETLDRESFRAEYTYGGDDEEEDDGPITKADAFLALATLKMEMAQLPEDGIQQHNLRNVERVLERLRDNGFVQA